MAIIVYSKPNCVQCNATYRALDKRGISYDVVDVTEDAAALGCEAEVAQARRILADGTSAERQAATFEGARDGDTSNRQALDAVVDWLARTTCGAA